MKTKHAAPLLAALILMAGCTTGAQPKSPSGTGSTGTSGAPAVTAKKLGYEIVKELPHDKDSFTQGLEVVGADTFAESDGRYGQSKVKLVKISTGEDIKVVDLPKKHFAEGLTKVGDQLVQITWKERTAHVWSATDLKKAETEFSYDGEGWGLCNDKLAGVVWRSDGTPTLNAHDPKTFRQTKKVTVTLDGKPLPQLNELECVDGKVWANVWQTNQIVQIDPASGAVVAYVDLTELKDRAQAKNGATFNADQVLNGIAQDFSSKDYYVTGKQWPTVFQIKIKEAEK